jgi:hypothetical protein
MSDIWEHLFAKPTSDVVVIVAILAACVVALTLLAIFRPWNRNDNDNPREDEMSDDWMEGKGGMTAPSDEGCDSCGITRTRVHYSRAHGAYFCGDCYKRENPTDGVS